MFKNKLFNSLNKINQNSLLKVPKSYFSNGGNNKVGRMFGYGALGLATGGLAFLTMRNMSIGANYSKQLLNTKESKSKMEVQERTKQTVLYFTGGLAATAGIATLMLRNPRLMNFAISPFSFFVAFPSLLFCSYKIHSTPVQDPLKNLYFLGYLSTMAFVICPLGTFIPISILRDAGIMTSGLMGGLGVVAFTSKDDAFLGWSGALGIGLGGLAALSIANIFLNSPIINSIWLWGGLALFSAMTMYDIKQVQIRAQKETRFDAMAQSLHIYQDFIQLFIRIAMILNNQKRK